MELLNYNIGFILPKENKHYIIDEHSSDILNVTENDFYEFVNQVETMFTKNMEFVKDRMSDLIKLKDLQLKTINLSVYDYSDIMKTKLIHNIGNLVVLKVYNITLYNNIMQFAEEVDGDLSEIYDFGREARNGVSVMEKYLNVLEDIVKQYPIKSN